MKIHWLQHVPFEGLGLIEKWANKNEHSLSSTRLQEGEPLPAQEEFDMLVVMGGPMGVHDEEIHPWLLPERKFLEQTVAAGKPILGICLGAQLLAVVLGAQVVPNKEKEIGWFPLIRDTHLPRELEHFLPEGPTVFHWHGDTFFLPEGARRLYTSRGCDQQGFLFGDRVMGLQFHLESTAESVALLVRHCEDELQPGKWIQTKADLLQTDPAGFHNEKILAAILEYLASKHP